MSQFRIFKQVPRLLFGTGTLKRLHELLPEKENDDYYIFVIDDALKNDPFIQYHLSWQQALEHLKSGGRRAEQQAFAVHDLNHVIDTYLPDKLAAVGDFLP